MVQRYQQFLRHTTLLLMSMQTTGLTGTLTSSGRTWRWSPWPPHPKCTWRSLTCPSSRHSLGVLARCTCRAEKPDRASIKSGSGYEQRWCCLSSPSVSCLRAENGSRADHLSRCQGRGVSARGLCFSFIWYLKQFVVVDNQPAFSKATCK